MEDRRCKFCKHYEEINEEFARGCWCTNWHYDDEDADITPNDTCEYWEGKDGTAQLG